MDSQIAMFQFWVCYVRDTSLIDFHGKTVVLVAFVLNYKMYGIY